jgi:hypothetical protein
MAVNSVIGHVALRVAVPTYAATERVFTGTLNNLEGVVRIAVGPVGTSGAVNGITPTAVLLPVDSFDWLLEV